MSDTQSSEVWAEIPEGFLPEPFHVLGEDVWCSFRLDREGNLLLVGVTQNGGGGYVPVSHDVLYNLVTGTDAYHDLVGHLSVKHSAILYDVWAMADAIPEDADIQYWIKHGVVYVAT